MGTLIRQVRSLSVIKAVRHLIGDRYISPLLSRARADLNEIGSRNVSSAKIEVKK